MRTKEQKFKPLKSCIDEFIKNKKYNNEARLICTTVMLAQAETVLGKSITSDYEETCVKRNDCRIIEASIKLTVHNEIETPERVYVGSVSGPIKLSAVSILRRMNLERLYEGSPKNQRKRIYELRLILIYDEK